MIGIASHAASIITIVILLYLLNRIKKEVRKAKAHVYEMRKNNEFIIEITLPLLYNYHVEKENYEEADKIWQQIKHKYGERPQKRNA